MDQNQEELKILIERENIVSKVAQLIDLKVNFYQEEGTEFGDKMSNRLGVLREELSAENALQILELILDGGFESMGVEELRGLIS